MMNKLSYNLKLANFLVKKWTKENKHFWAGNSNIIVFLCCFSGEAAAGGSGGEAGVDGKALSTGDGSHGESLPGAGSSSDHDIEEANSSADPDEETDHHHADQVTPSHGKKLFLWSHL